MVGYYSSGVKLPSTGGNNANEPIWKKLGYPSEQAYLNAVGGGSSLANYVTPPIATSKPILQTPSLENYFNGNVSRVNGGISGGGVTDEGVISPDVGIDNSTFNNINAPSTGKSTMETKHAEPTLTAGVENKEENKEPASGAVPETGNEPTGTGSNSSGEPVEGSREWWNKFYDDQKNMLLSLYAGTQKKLDDEKKNSQQAASITYDKLKKYLPTQIKAQGLGGLGVSESTMLQAQNNYVNQMGNIGSEYSANTAELESKKTSALSELENYRADTLDGIQTKEWQTAYENATVSIDNSGIFDQEQMTSFVEQFKGKVSDSQFNALLARGQSVATANKQYRDDIAEEEAKQQQKEETAKEEARRQEAQDEIVSFLTVNYEEIEDWAGGLAYLEANEGAFVNKELYNNLHSAYSSKLTAQQEAEAKAEAEAKQAEYDKNVIEGKQYVRSSVVVWADSDGAEKSKSFSANYQITGEASGDDVNSSEFKAGLNALGASGPSSSNLKNGTVIEVTQDSGWEWIDSVYNYTFGLILPKGNAVPSVTTKFIYYNGKWYKCKQV